MVRDIVKDEAFLARRSEPAGEKALSTAQDLLDTLAAHREGCLSLDGTRKTRRRRSIKVRYQNEKFQVRFKAFTGRTAQIIQHEADHCHDALI